MASHITISVVTVFILISPSTANIFNVWSGENLDDIIMKTDGSGTTDKNALLVIYDSSCSQIMTYKLGISSFALPPTSTLVYLQHDYRTAQEHTWFKDNGDDLRVRFKVGNCPEVLFISRGTTKSDPVATWQWSLDPSISTVPFRTWVWDQIKVKVIIKNFKDLAVKVRVERLDVAGPSPQFYPQFSMMPGETKEISIYESSLVMTYTAGRHRQTETFIGAWEVTGPMVINLINSPGDDRLEEMVRSDIQSRFEKEDVRIREWLRTNSDRYLLNLKQPLLVHKLTEHGYRVRKIPEQWYSVLRQFYDAHKPLSQEETWPFIDSVINYDEVPNDMIELTSEVKTYVADGLKTLMEEWCDCMLEMTAFYGVRVYHNGSILRNHVDRIETHVISAILQIDQQVRTPWLLEVIDYQGDRHHIELSAGEMLMYESAKLVHGRPQPLNGDLYANVFLHYRPQSGWNDYKRHGGLLSKGDQIESLMPLNSPLTQKNAHKRKVFYIKSKIKDEL